MASENYIRFKENLLVVADPVLTLIFKLTSETLKDIVEEGNEEWAELLNQYEFYSKGYHRGFKSLMWNDFLNSNQRKEIMLDALSRVQRELEKHEFVLQEVLHSIEWYDPSLVVVGPMPTYLLTDNIKILQSWLENDLRSMDAPLSK